MSMDAAVDAVADLCLPALLPGEKTPPHYDGAVYDPDGKIIGHMSQGSTWLMVERWRQEHPETCTRKTQLGLFRVSTIYIGLNRQFPSGGLPLFWETMIFSTVDFEESSRFRTWRYSSRHAAMVGHNVVVAALLPYDR